MRVKKNALVLLGLAATAALVLGGCSWLHSLHHGGGKGKLVVCMKCGELKGSAKCCAPGAVKCPKCGMNKGSIGCCRHLKPAPGEKEVVLCPRCGQVKGSALCCVAGAPKCPKCGMAKGSPGCCKLK